MNPKPSGTQMTLGNMRSLGVRRLSVQGLNARCRHEALLDVNSCSDDVPVPSFGMRIVCAKCGMTAPMCGPN